MSDLPDRIVVVGASAAGLSAAEGLRAHGFDGPLTLVGAEDQLPYDRPPLSKQLLQGDWEPDRLELRSRAALAALELDLRLGRPATALHTGRREVRLATGERLRYRALVIATGSTPRLLPGTSPGAAPAPGTHTLRTLGDALALRRTLRRTRRLVIVGSGFIGNEVAAVAAGLGVDVALVSATRIPLSDAVGEEIGAFLARTHREHGVRLHTGVRARRVLVEEGRTCGVELQDGTSLPADTVLLAVGAGPAVDWLVGSGLTVDDGVRCDATLCAGPGVWAAGDVARWTHPRTGLPTRIEHRTNAAEQGLAVARNILAPPGGAEVFDPVPYVWSDLYGLRVQIYGRTRGADEVRVVEGSTEAGRLVALCRADGRVGGVIGVNLPRQTRNHRALVARRAPWDEAVGAGGPDAGGPDAGEPDAGEPGAAAQP
nr:FAD-dependent oxidoreductase [Streptacidiphilus albus]